MLIAIDYDETYTEDPELWNDFIKNAIARGHRVICVTMRYEHEQLFPGETIGIQDTIGKLCGIIYTGRKAKASFVLKYGFNPDIWIDDDPEKVHNDYGKY